jgi:hypothetical protein
MKPITKSGYVPASSYIGIPELKNNVYVYGVSNQAVKYMKTTEAIAEYVGTKYSKELWTLVHHKEEATFKEPTPPVEQMTRQQ